MILVDVILIVFWLGFLMYGVVSWAINKSFEQLNDIERIEMDEIDRDNVG